jgi:NADH dehydrogenase
VAVGQAALRVGARRILYGSSVGAGEPRGRFLHWKREAERWLEQSGLDWTVLRPSFLTGRGHRTPLLLLPLLAWSPELRPLPVADLARALTRCLAEPSVTVGRTFEGQALRALAQ